ncbi:glycosyltransferase family 4 protein [Desulfurella sp.]|uniref:glycosyltransferase family 4 protein n=1 Tax=Desulfurella sp. TaxID=1962857 RepID=UPI003D0DCA63
MKKVLLVYKKLSNYGGTERYIVYTAKKLIEKGCSVKILTSQINGIDTSKFDIKILKVPHWPSWLKLVSFAVASYIYTKKAKKDNYISYCFGNSIGCDILRVSGGAHKFYVKQAYLRHTSKLSLMLAKLKRNTSLYHFFLLYIQKKAFTNKNTKYFVVPSELVKNQLVQGYNVDSSKIVIQYNKIDLSKYNSQNKNKAFLQALNLNPDKFYFLYVSTNFWLKGFSYLLEAFSIASKDSKFFEKAHLIAVGQDNIKKFQTKAKNIKLDHKVSFFGKRNDLENFYKSSDCFVYPSLYDSAGFVIEEALACGLPTIASKFAGYSELVEKSKAGVVIDPTNLKQFSKALLDFFYKKNDELELMSCNASNFMLQLNKLENEDIFGRFR